MWLARYDTLMVIQYSGPDSWGNKHYNRFYFRLFIILIYQDKVPLAAFWGFVGPWCRVIRVGIPPFLVFSKPPKYNK